MIRITVELLPFGDVERAHVLGIVHVGNAGTTPDDIGTYRVRDALAEGEAAEVGTVRGHNRKHGWRPLVARVMALVARKERR